MGVLSGFYEQLSPKLVAAWLFVTELIPNREAVLREAELTTTAFADALSSAYALLSSRVVIAIIAAYVLYKIISLVFFPYQRITRNHEVGYVPEASGQSHYERSLDVRRRRRTGDLPPVYPNGL